MYTGNDLADRSVSGKGARGVTNYSLNSNGLD